MAEDKRNKDDDKYGALFVPAGVLTGVGVGFLIGNVAAGTLIGLGVGFIIFATITVVKKK
jgi:divalent metal cation (Fe/Co/Zn/Cd) transporter